MGRIKQFFRDLTAPARPVEDGFLGEMLEAAETELIHRLRRAELLHAIAVARYVRDNLPPGLDPGEERAIVRAALLHDIGKTVHPVNVLQKSLVVLLPGRFREDPRLIDRWKPLAIYHHHPEYGRDIVLSTQSFAQHPWLVELIRCHHDRAAFARHWDTRELAIFDLIQTADDLY